jgi:UDP-glucose 4-epimerase
MNSLRGKSVLVTGGAGFIGSHVVDELVKEKPTRIVVVDNFFLGNMRNLKPAMEKFDAIKIYREDAAGYVAMENIMLNEKVDVVFDLAVKPLPYSFINPEGAYMTSVDIANVLVSLLRKKLYETLIHVSSSEAYGTAEYVPMDEKHPLNPTTPYSAGKAAADLLIMSYYRTFDLDVAIVRPFNNYGPRHNNTTYAAIIPLTVERILNGEKPYIEWDGKQTRDFIYVTDTARAIVDTYKYSETRGKVMNVASGVETRIEDILELLIKNLGYDGGTLRKPKRPGDVRRHCADISLAKGLINLKPAVPLDKGIRETVRWFKKIKEEE